MSRSAVLTGRIDARDRAKLRGRLDPSLSRQTDPFEQIWAWIETSGYGDEEREAMARVDLDEYLRNTGHIELAAEERLRQLAMFMESYYGAVSPDALDRIYEAAVRLNPDNALIWHSRGISAKFAAIGAKKASLAARFTKLALRWLHHAWELDATDAGVAYSIGKWHTEFGAVADAAEWFERTLCLESDHGYALLHRAHCLHDQEIWKPAVEAYEAVPLETFKGPQAWLVDIVLEAQAYCRLRAGDRQGAIDDFERLLNRFAKEPQAKMLALAYLTKACCGPLRDELWSAYSALHLA